MILCQSCHVKIHFLNGDYKGRKKIELNVKKIKEMYENGYSLVRLSKIFNVSAETIKNRLKEQNVHIRSYKEQYYYERSRNFRN